MPKEFQKFDYRPCDYLPAPRTLLSLPGVSHRKGRQRGGVCTSVSGAQVCAYDNCFYILGLLSQGSVSWKQAAFSSSLSFQLLCPCCAHISHPETLPRFLSGAMHVLRSSRLGETKVDSAGNKLPTRVLIWSFDCGKQRAFSFTLQSSLVTPSEAALWLQLLAWARVTGEILILPFLKGRRLALSVTTGPLVRDAQLESFKPASLAAHGAVKSVGKSKSDSSTWIRAPEVGAFMK